MNAITPWILLDTKTTGFTKPVFALELAAQKMRGWERDGQPFRHLLNHDCAIAAEAAQVNGYTREVLERDGSPPAEVYREFAAYAASLPVVAFNLEYDWEDVLLPEWQRLGISQIGVPGFCALKLAQRLLDPVPAGNCKLQTLRQYYRLPENGAQTALGDVLTVIDLMQQVLRPLAERRGLDTWEKIVGFTGDEWFPSRLSFGKFKGRLYQEAGNDGELKSWLEWLAESTNERSSSMGRWYLGQLASGATLEDATFLDVEMPGDADDSAGGLVVFRHPGLGHYQRLIEAARSRLADLELDYGVEKSKVDSVRSRLFGALRFHHPHGTPLPLRASPSQNPRTHRNPRHPTRQPGLRSLPVRRERRRRDRHHRRRAAGGTGERDLRLAGRGRAGGGGSAGIGWRGAVLKWVARPRRRPQDNEGRKLDSKRSRKAVSRANLSRFIGMRSRR